MACSHNIAIIQGTTPELEFRIPYLVEDILEAYITISKPFGPKILEYSLKDNNVLFEDELLRVKMSQEDTLRVGKTATDVEIQLKFKTVDENVVASTIIHVTFDRALKAEVI